LKSKKTESNAGRNAVKIIRNTSCKNMKTEHEMKHKIEQQKEQRATLLAETLRTSETARRWPSQKYVFAQERLDMRKT
jgi:hypothetical protein